MFVLKVAPRTYCSFNLVQTTESSYNGDVRAIVNRRSLYEIPQQPYLVNLFTLG